MIPDRFRPVLDELHPLTERFAAAGHRLYLVGGTVRDLLIVRRRRDDHDFDATTTARPPRSRRCSHGWADAIWTQGERFGTIGAKKDGRDLRDHDASRRGVHRRLAQAHVEFADEIETDLSRRDFTVNAMALELTVDDADARRSVRRRRRPGDTTRCARRCRPRVSFSDDPLRMLRAARFIARYQLAAGARAGRRRSRRCTRRLSIVSAERIRDELDKLITVDHPGAGLWFVDRHRSRRRVPAGAAGDAPRAGPDPPPQGRADPHDRGRRERRAATPRPDFDFRRTRLAALFHDVGKPQTRGYHQGQGRHVPPPRSGRRADDAQAAAPHCATRNDDVEAITELVALHLRFHTYADGLDRFGRAALRARRRRRCSPS